ncbi:hypothetical protein BG653_05634 [Streptomyces platensis]|uniref:PepSY-associated TM helix n=1 Tax=Streptomyces platensis TaxID=58346 RepID=A0ABX3XQ81_STRPT|nr:hypothetical protein BG653_05634 [Streptomyces platensis]
MRARQPPVWGSSHHPRELVFVDPYTGNVRGALDTYGSTGALPLRTWLDALHRDLHLGETGRLYSELAASWLWVVAGGGVALWIGRKRRNRKLRTLALPDRTATGRRRTLSWHGAVGLWAAAGLIFLILWGYQPSPRARHHCGLTALAARQPSGDLRRPGGGTGGGLGVTVP